MIVTCRECGESRPHHARGLCSRCYQRQWYAGSYDTDRRFRPSAGVVEDAEWLASSGCGWREAAARLGYKETAHSPSDSGLCQALRRAGRMDVWVQLREAC